MTLGSQIERIVGQLAEGERRLTSFIITYVDGVQEHRAGTLDDAAELAVTQGLVMVPTVGGWFHWVRDPEGWWDPP